jgi:1-acyl-sn-glycerol-3-phosphate acyltransferase
MRFIQKLLHRVYFIYAALVFIILMIPVFLIALVASFFGKITGGNIIYHACMIWGDVWFFLLGIMHKNIYEQPLKKKQSYIFIANHISYLDTPIIVKTFRRNIRPLGKVEMSKIPVFGFIYRNVIVTVDRSSSSNRSKSVQTLKSILSKGISVLVFPEGTFNLTHKPLKEFYDGAFRVAIETGTPIKPVLILDSYDRMNYDTVFSLNPGKSRSVFLEEISVQGLTPNDLQELKTKVFELMQAKLCSYGASWIAGHQPKHIATGVT